VVGESVTEKSVAKKTARIVKGNRSKFAMAVAKKAYNKFGNRKMTEANMLVTRKWLQKYLDDAKFCDLRTVDKNVAIDRALFLSFVPTAAFHQARKVMDTKVANEAVTGEKSLFGRVFRIQRSTSTK